MSDTVPFRPEARSPRGFQDRRARDLRAERTILMAVSAVYERYGFEQLDTPAFEYADALGKFLPDSDRPNEGVFAMQDDDEQWMALRYDLTAPLARFAAQTWETLPKPFRRYAFGTVWRNEKPGPAASANSSSATPTPSAPPAPRRTRKSSPWRSRGWRPPACRAARRW